MSGAGYRVLFMLRLAPGSADAFLRAYDDIRHEVARVPGHLRDQVCQATDDPDQWLITSEWRSADDFLAWESSPGHRELAGPMMRHVVQRRSLRFSVQRETSGGDLAARGAR